ncbi:MAG: tripartite tricarboxylate transporter substrate binding protein [Burkholderiales bacterium]
MKSFPSASTPTQNAERAANHRANPSRRGIGALLAAAAIGAALVAAPVLAQDYPTRPIRLVVPFPPGGANDIVARVVAPKLSDSLGQPVVIDNRGGAAGTIGADYVAKSAPDGYTLLMTPAPFVITQSLYKKLPYDGQRDFVPVALLTSAPFVLAVGAKSPANSMADLLALARSKPGTVNFSSPGNGSPAHLAGELLKTRTGLDMLHVPYKGGGPAVTDMIAGHVSFTLATPAEIMPHVKEGKARALAVTTADRTPLAQGVPTMREAGVPDYEITVWYGITAPRGTPSAVVARLEKAFAEVMANPEVRERMISMGLEPTPMSAAQFGEFLKREQSKWAELVRVSGATAD